MADHAKKRCRFGKPQWDLTWWTRTSFTRSQIRDSVCLTFPCLVDALADDVHDLVDLPPFFSERTRPAQLEKFGLVQGRGLFSVHDQVAFELVEDGFGGSLDQDGRIGITEIETSSSVPCHVRMCHACPPNSPFLFLHVFLPFLFLFGLFPFCGHDEANRVSSSFSRSANVNGISPVYSIRVRLTSVCDTDFGRCQRGQHRERDPNTTVVHYIAYDTYERRVQYMLLLIDT